MAVRACVSGACLCLYISLPQGGIPTPADFTNFYVREHLVVPVFNTCLAPMWDRANGLVRLSRPAKHLRKAIFNRTIALRRVRGRLHSACVLSAAHFWQAFQGTEQVDVAFQGCPLLASVSRESTSCCDQSGFPSTSCCGMVRCEYYLASAKL
jgi:hypothetical protein